MASGKSHTYGYKKSSKRSSLLKRMQIPLLGEQRCITRNGQI
ncbi:hypothetical protein COLO4_33840 [Corchorus olitorius]|uniref:Uncharacterized protein n=1 Tax=Corchorus olitorius TaxID=93759 RepID=A0A1R3GQQ3_9ROSI|nr:hypothetical protein COLO4_33840 [Corchorus olitorius]